MSTEDMLTLAKDSGVFTVSAFAKKLVSDALENMEEIDGYIDANLIGWSAQRISKVSRAILRLAVSELKFSDIPVGVAVNEAVELAKKYSTETDASFVNGILASIIKQVRE